MATLINLLAVNQQIPLNTIGIYFKINYFVGVAPYNLKDPSLHSIVGLMDDHLDESLPQHRADPQRMLHNLRALHYSNPTHHSTASVNLKKGNISIGS